MTLKASSAPCYVRLWKTNHSITQEIMCNMPRGKLPKSNFILQCEMMGCLRLCEWVALEYSRSNEKSS